MYLDRFNDLLVVPEDVDSQGVYLKSPVGQCFACFIDSLPSYSVIKRLMPNFSGFAFAVIDATGEHCVDEVILKMNVKRKNVLQPKAQKNFALYITYCGYCS